MKSKLAVLLAIELPFMLVSLALTSWGLHAIALGVRFNELSGTRKGFESGEFGFQYGTQVVTLTSTRSFYGGQPVPPTPTVVTYTLYPIAQGTIAYTSIYSQIGYIPTPVTSFSPTIYTSTRTSDNSAFLTTASIAQRDVPPAVTAAPNEKREWADNSSDDSRGLYSVSSDTLSFLQGVLGCLALVVAFQAVRVLATILFLALCGFIGQEKGRRFGALIMLVTVTTVAFMAILGGGVAAFALLGYWYETLIAQSPGILATMVFYGINVIATLVVLVSSCVALHRQKRQRRSTLGYQKEVEKRRSQESRRSDQA